MRRNKLGGWNVDNLLEELSLAEIIEQKIYGDISLLKNLRNGIYHKGAEV